MPHSDTVAVHGGEPTLDRKDAPMTPDISVGSASGYPDLASLDVAMAEHRGYGRWGTENHRQLQAAVAGLEANGLDTRLDAVAVGYSATRSLSGHADVVGGLVVGKASWTDGARAFAQTFGPTLGPFDAWLTLRGIRTLAVRMARHTANALALARFLERHQAVRQVNYPELEGSPFCARARELLPAGAGALLSFELEGGRAALEKMIGRLKLVRLVPSLGNVATTLSHPASTSHRGLTADERGRAGISDGLVRCSVGLEHPDDLLEEFQRALTASS